MTTHTLTLLLCSFLFAGSQQAPVVSIEPRSATIRQGESISFKCRVQGGGQNVQLEWKRSNNQPLADNVKIGPDGSVITFTNTRVANQGNYRCTASGSQGKAHSTASLSLKQSPKVRVSPGNLVEAQVGEPVSLECHATGRPRPTINWSRQGHETALSPTTSTENTAVIELPAARLEDAGIYVCRVQNSEGFTETKVELKVEDSTQGSRVPTASIVPGELMAVEGQSVKFQCHASGVPTPNISWSKLRAPLPWLHQVQGNTLILQNVGRQDSGQYICNATNDAGYIEATAQLEIETPPYATSLPDDLRVRPGETIRLQCLVHGSPPIRLQWSKARGNLPPRAETQDGLLIISQARAADAGNYKCVATNAHGSSEAVAKVTVRCE